MDKIFTSLIFLGFFVLLSSGSAPRWAVRRPALAGVLLVAIIFWGMFCLREIPVELMPNLASETVSVAVNVRGGMPPQDVETLIVRPLEDALGDLPRLKDILASAKKDRCVISLIFQPGTDMKSATGAVHERMERAAAKLPREIEKPVISHFDESDAPIFIAALASRSLTPEEIRQLVEAKIKDLILRVPGVANVEIGGGRESKILVEVDRMRLAAYHLSIHRLVSALSRQNIGEQVGSFADGRRVTPIRLSNTFQTVEEMRRVPVAKTGSGGLVLLENVASVSKSYLEPESISRLNGQAAVSIYIQKESSANALRSARMVEKAFEMAWDRLPAPAKRDLDKVVVANQADNIESAIHAVRVSLIFGIVLIILVQSFLQSALPLTRRMSLGVMAILMSALCLAALFKVPQTIFEWPLLVLLAALVLLAFPYEDMRPPLIVASIIPFSVLISLIFFRFSGISLNVMSLFGLALGIGLLVDNAIVVYQNISRRLEAAPAGREEAVIKAAEEMAGLLTGATLTMTAAFIPFFFLSHEVRALYSDVAAAVMISLISSQGAALTLVPLLSAHVSVRPRENRWTDGLRLVFAGNFLAKATTAAAAAKKTASRSLMKITSSLGARISWKDTLIVIAFIFIGLWWAGALWAAKMIFALSAAAFVGFGFSKLQGYESFAYELIKNRFSICGLTALLGAAAVSILVFGTEKDFKSANPSDEFVVYIELSSGVRVSVADEIAAQVENRIREDKEAASCIKTLVARVEGWSSKIYVTLKPRTDRRLSTQEVIDRLRDVLKDAGRDKDENAFIHFSSAEPGQELAVQVAGPDYALLEEHAQKISAGLEGIAGLTDVKMRYRPGRPEVEIFVNPWKAKELRLSAENIVETVHALVRGLRATTYRTRSNQIETIVRLRSPGKNSLSELPDLPLLNPRAQAFRLGDVADFRMGRMPNEIYRENKERLIEITANRAKLPLGRAADQIDRVLAKIPLSLDYQASLTGDVRETISSFRQMAWGIVLMAGLIYLTLVVLFESLLKPFIIMAAIPLSSIGVAWGVVIFGLPLTLGVLMGITMLGGIVVSNAVMLMDEFNRGDPGLPPEERLIKAGRARMRPLFLAASTTILGFFPMMLDTSESGTIWRPLSIAMVFGLLTSTILTLYAIPVLTSVLLSDIPKLARKFSASKSSTPEEI